MDERTYAFNPTRRKLARVAGSARISALAGLFATHLSRRLRLSSCVVLVRELTVDVDHLSASRDIELVLRSACGALNDGNTCTPGHCHLDSILTADWTREDGGQFLLHDPDDTPTSTTHASFTERMGDPPLISTFHDSSMARTSKRYQGRRMMMPEIRYCIPWKSLQNERTTRSITH